MDIKLILYLFRKSKLKENILKEYVRKNEDYENISIHNDVNYPVNNENEPLLKHNSISSLYSK